MECDRFCFKVAVYNTGQNADFKQLLMRNGKDSPDQEIVNLYQKLKPDYDNAIKEFNVNKENKKYWQHPDFNVTENDKKIFSEVRLKKLERVYKLMKDHCSIVLLQEVGMMDQVEFVKCKFSNDFEWAFEVGENYQKKPIADTLIGWNKKEFAKLHDPQQDIKISNIKSICVTLCSLATGKIINVASLHAPGFDIKNPTQESVQAGNKVVSSVLEILQSSKTQQDFAIVGGDYNALANPTHYTDEQYSLAHRRFEILDEQHYIYVSQNQPTAYNKAIAELQNGNGKCDLDHLYVKDEKALSKVKALLKKPFCFEIENPSENPSDHRPLFYSVKIGKTT